MTRSKARSSRSKKTPAWVLPLVIGVFLLFGVFGTWFLLVRPLSRLWDARGWEGRDCEVISSEVGTHDSDDGYTYSIDVEYRYEVDGRTYTSDRYDFMGGSSSGYAGKKAVVDRHPPGAVVTCWIDPEDPSQAVLDRSFRAIYLIGLFPLVFLAVGAGGVFFWIVSKLPSKAATPADLETGFREAPEIGPKVLEPRASPLGKVFGSLLIALFWNGIVSVFVYQEYLAWRHGEGFAFGCGTLFLIPFVLVGLALIGLVFYTILALANPRPRLILDPGSPALGETAALRWELTGAVGRIRHWTITLQGKEEATYRRGTDSHTDRHVFYEETLFETSQRLQMGRGSTSVEIPADQMHSFGASNNKVVWALTVHGDVARWPDVAEELPITIRPAEIE